MPSMNHSGRHTFIHGKDRHICGWHPSTPDHRDLTVESLVVKGRLKAVPLPSSFDLASQCTAIENQGELGSCTANAATSAMEFMHRKLGLGDVNLSRLFVYYYTRKIEGTPATEDAGASMRNTMKALAAFGSPSETVWPYEVGSFSTPPSYAAIKDALKHKVTSYFRCSHLGSLKLSLVQGFTVAGGFSVPETIFNAPGGVVDYPTASVAIVGGHAVHFVGYDDGKALVKFQNSWGIGWGDGGFGYLPYQFFQEGLAGDLWTIRRET